MLTSYILPSVPFHTNMNLMQWTLRNAMDMYSTQSVSILETFNAQKYRIFKLNFYSCNFHIFRFRARSGKGEVFPNIAWVQITTCVFVTIPCHIIPFVIMHEVFLTDNLEIIISRYLA